MISDKMSSALNEQINAELRSAYLYLAMSLEADSLTLRGVANWFYIQCQEEQDHARIFQKYLIDQDKQVELKSIPAFVTGWKSPVDMFREALAHEKEVTRMINELVELAYAEGDFATLERLQWFVREQVEEEASARYQITAFGRVEDNLEMLDFNGYQSLYDYEKIDAGKSSQQYVMPDGTSSTGLFSPFYRYNRTSLLG